MKKKDIIEYIKEKHKGQTRKQGTPYYLHPIAVSKMLKDKGFSEDYQIAGLLHDVLEDTDTTYEEILEKTNEKIAEAVLLVTKEKGYEMKTYMERIQKNEMAKMVKLADRIHNLIELPLAPLPFQEEYLAETEKWFLELAKDTVFEAELYHALENIQLKIKQQKIELRKRNEE